MLGSEVEPYLLRALLRRTDDPEDLVVQVLHLLDLDPRLHTLLVEGPPEGFTWVAPSGGLDTWRDQIAPRSPGWFRGWFGGWFRARSGSRR